MKPFHSKLKANFDRRGFCLKYLCSLLIICGFVKLCFVIVPVTDFFVKTLQLLPSKLLGAINIYRQKGQKRGYLQYSTMVLLVSGSFSQRKKYFETVILKQIVLFKRAAWYPRCLNTNYLRKILTFSPPDFLKMTIFRKKIRILHVARLMWHVSPPGNLLNLTKLFHLFPTGSKNLWPTLTALRN